MIDKSYLSKFKIGKSNPDLALSDEIYQYFQKRLPFPRIMKYIKSFGRQAIFENFNEVRKSDATDHLSLFIWRCKQERVMWEKGE